jgi:hypothetical protein
MARRKKKELSTEQRMSAFLVLKENKNDGRPVRGAAQRLAIQFNVDKTTINRLWRVTKNKLDTHLNIQNGEPVDNPAINNRAINDLIHDIEFYESGRKLSGNNPKWDIPQLLEVVRAMPLTERQSIRQLAKNLSIPCSTLHGIFKQIDTQQ